jgi:hypothetical protein
VKRVERVQTHCLEPSRKTDGWQPVRSRRPRGRSATALSVREIGGSRSRIGRA